MTLVKAESEEQARANLALRRRDFYDVAFGSPRRKRALAWSIHWGNAPSVWSRVESL